MKYYKVWFSNGKERTAGLVLDAAKYDPRKTSLAEYSRLFPMGEAMKMHRFMCTSLYDSWVEAFMERGKAQDACLVPEEQFYAYDATGAIIGVRGLE